MFRYRPLAALNAFAKWLHEEGHQAERVRPPVQPGL
jgi:hypothetical protein